MKKLILAVLLCTILLLILSGCSKKDGDVLLRINLNGNHNYWDNNPSIPDNFTDGKYYKTDTGTYSFYYTSWSGQYFTGTYKLTKKRTNVGIFAFLISIPDVKCTLDCTEYGPDLTIDDDKGNIKSIIPDAVISTRIDQPIENKLFKR